MKRVNSDVLKESVPANFVPAAAVIRWGRALFVLNGRKGCVDYFCLIALERLLLVKYEAISENLSIFRDF